MVEEIICDDCLDCAYDERKHFKDVKGYCDFDCSSDFIEKICREFGEYLKDHTCLNREEPDIMKENNQRCVCPCNEKLR